MNKVSLIGNVTRDIEIKTVETNGKTYAPFTLAVTQYRGADKAKDTVFVNVVAFGNKAEILAKYITKGQKLAVEGRLAESRYKNKEGIQINTMNVILEDFTFIGEKKAVNE